MKSHFPFRVVAVKRNLEYPSKSYLGKFNCEISNYPMLQTFPPLFFHFFTNKIEEIIEIPFLECRALQRCKRRSD
jgi:hypothetical protein